MNAVAETSLILQRELRRTFKSVKGILLATLSLLGGISITLLLVKLQQLKADAHMGDASPADMHDLREKILTQSYGDPKMGHYLADSPEALFAVFLLGVWLTPLLIVLLGFDGIASDVQHRSVRYWTVRARRPSFFVGKYLGLWASISIITLTMHLFIWIICIARGEATAAATFSWGLRFWLISLPISAAWCGVATFVGSLFRVPILSLLVTLAVFFVMWLLWVIGSASHTEALKFIYPNHYDEWLLSPQLERVAAGAGICIGFAAAMVAAGSVLFAQKDV